MTVPESSVSTRIGWSFESTRDPRYSLIRYRGVPIAGVVDVTGRHRVDVSQWVALLSVGDVDTATSAVRRAGGEVHVDPIDGDEPHTPLADGVLRSILLYLVDGSSEESSLIFVTR